MNAKPSPKPACPLEMQEQIELALRRSPEPAVRRIRVVAQDHTAHLYGDVPSCFEQDMAVGTAWATPGVSCVVNHINVRN